MISEAHARQLIGDRLRGEGLRILFDVELEVSGHTVVLDGYDPQRAIGFEYTAAEEAGQQRPVTNKGGPAILWVGPSTEADVLRRLDAFVARHLTTDAGP